MHCGDLLVTSGGAADAGPRSSPRLIPVNTFPIGATSFLFGTVPCFSRFSLVHCTPTTAGRVVSMTVPTSNRGTERRCPDHYSQGQRSRAAAFQEGGR